MPCLKPAVELSSACDAAGGLALIPCEEERGTGLKTAVARWRQEGRSVSSVSLFIGPEGGLTSQEIEGARASGVAPVSQGRRLLRVETAAIATVAAVLYEVGELGG